MDPTVDSGRSVGALAPPGLDLHATPRHPCPDEDRTAPPLPTPAARAFRGVMEGLVAVAVPVAAGSAAGGIARQVVSALVAHAIGQSLPWGTLVVNVSGCFALGLLAPLVAGGGGWVQAGPLVATGFLGGYTTVSSFSLQTLMLVRAGAFRKAAAYVGLSLGLCIAAAALGWRVAAGQA